MVESFSINIYTIYTSYILCHYSVHKPNQDITMVDLFSLEDLKDQTSMRNESVAYYYSTDLLTARYAIGM
jgi:hypothetical protein